MYEDRTANPDNHIQQAFACAAEVYLFKRCDCNVPVGEPAFVNVEGDLRCCVCGSVVHVELTRETVAEH